MCFLARCMSSLEKHLCFYVSPAHFFIGWVFFPLILSCISCLYILESNALSVALFANIFSHSDGQAMIL